MMGDRGAYQEYMHEQLVAERIASESEVVQDANDGIRNLSRVELRVDPN
jgi:hypothetical protein